MGNAQVVNRAQARDRLRWGSKYVPGKSKKVSISNMHLYLI